MSNKQYTVNNADVGAATFAVPGDQPGTDASFQVDTAALDDRQEWYVHVENGLDVNVDVTVQGSHHLDESMAAAADDGATETISSGANGVFSGTTGHSYIQVEVTTATDPLAGDLTVTFQAR